MVQVSRQYGEVGVGVLSRGKLSPGHMTPVPLGVTAFPLFLPASSVSHLDPDSGMAAGLDALTWQADPVWWPVLAQMEVRVSVIGKVLCLCSLILHLGAAMLRLQSLTLQTREHISLLGCQVAVEKKNI